MPKASCLIVLVLLLIQNVAPQTPGEVHERILRTIAERNYLAAADELRQLESSNPEIFKANHYDYLFGRVAEKAGDTATAMEKFQGVASRDSVLKPYALWHLSRLARASGNLVLERVYLQELMSLSANSLLAPPARRRLAESWFDSGNYDLAIRQVELAPAQTAAVPVPTRRKETAFLADAYMRSGNTTKAKELYTSLVNDLQNPAQPDDFALAGVRGLDVLESTPAGPPELNDYEHLSRASIYQFNRDFEHARVHYAAIINDHPTSGIVPDAIFQIGRGYAQQGDFTEALRWFERVLERFPEHQASQETLLQAASAYARLGKHHEAVARYKKYIEKYPEGDRVDRAYLNIIDVLRDTREEIEAIKWINTIRDKFKGRQPEALATFAEAKIYLARTNWENALATLDALLTMPDLGGTNVPGGTTPAEVRFLRGYTLEQLRRFPEAIDAYLSIPDGRNEYYGGRATERLRLLMGNELAKSAITAKAAELKKVKPTDPDGSRRALQASLRLTDQAEERSSMLASLRAAYAAIPAYASPKFKFVDRGRKEPINKQDTRPQKAADELLFLGLYDEAAAEAELNGATIVGPASPAKADIDYTNAVLYTRGDMAYRGAAFIESAWKIPADYQIELLPPDVLSLLYPTPYVDALIKHAPQRNVDPRFLLSIMRQESRYRPDVKSYAAARGLMQFISTTSTRIAAELQLSDFRQDDLYDPSTSILFGSHYVANLFKLFPAQPPAVAASYNGGEDNMKRWLARAKSDLPGRYIPEIAFAQSKDYVYRVMSNYRMYQVLYGEDLKRR